MQTAHALTYGVSPGGKKVAVGITANVGAALVDVGVFVEKWLAPAAAVAVVTVATLTIVSREEKKE